MILQCINYSYCHYRRRPCIRWIFVHSQCLLLAGQAHLSGQLHLYWPLTRMVLVSGQLQLRTPFSRPEGVRLRELPLNLYCKTLISITGPKALKIIDKTFVPDLRTNCTFVVSHNVVTCARFFWKPDLVFPAYALFSKQLLPRVTNYWSNLLMFWVSCMFLSSGV